MGDIAIHVENLGKQYQIGRTTPYSTFRETISNAVSMPFRRFTGTHEGNGEGYFWALKDVSFDLQKGEVLGIIGRNGAGKSTLLKILSRITSPTEGRAEIYGRVGSLLEVGTGFHPELTGRENIYLSGSILGMKRSEIDSKFDEIVKFAQTEKFLETPLKHYSSGMQVRLGFAVAAHLEPEILIIDEVLAVGDSEFQKKCINKMSAVSRDGRTIIFVSHNMVAVKKICTRAILLNGGLVSGDGNTFDIIKKYESKDIINSEGKIWTNPDTAPGNDIVRLHSIHIRDKNNVNNSDILSQDPFDIVIDYWNLKDNTKIGTTIVIYNNKNECILGSMSNFEKKWNGKLRPKGLYRSVCHIPSNFFPDGQLIVSVIFWGENYAFIYKQDELISLNIHEAEGSVRGDYVGGMDGFVRPLFPWETELLQILDS